MTIKPGSFGSKVSQQLSLVAVLVIVCAIFGTLTDRFLTTQNMINVLAQSSATIVAALGMTLVIVTRGIDLSVGSVANCAIAFALLLAGTGTGEALNIATSMWVYPAALMVGLILGLLNAAIITCFNISPLIATIGTLTLYRGVGLHLTSAASIAMKGALLDFADGSLFGVSFPIWAAIVGTFAAWVLLNQTVFGRQLLALGGSPRSAAESGIKTNRLLFVVYALSGVCAALAGLIVAGRVGIVDTSLGLDFEFTVITAVVLGGTSLFGGRGSIVGSLLGAVLLSTIDNGLNLIGANPFIYAVVRGLILMLAIALDAYANRLQSRQLAGEMS